MPKPGSDYSAIIDYVSKFDAMFGPESYHLHDYGFFFNNFKQNVADRVKAFLESNE